jgi:8-oxo-dGTP pyrophosphatase MutT (NUDIX family)
MPLVLMTMRWDGAVGFAGGVVEPDEAADAKAGAVAVRAAAEQALRRELREEVGVTDAGELEHAPHRSQRLPLAFLGARN